MVESPRQDNSKYPNTAVKTIRSHRIRCFEQGLGSSAEQSNSYRRSLVSSRDDSPYQLSGDVSCPFGNKGIWQKLEGHYSLDPNGQFHSSDIHQSEGGHMFQTIVPVGNQRVELVPRKEHHVAGQTSTRQAQSDSRYRVKNSERPLRLDAQSGGLPEDLDTDGTIGGGPACFKANQTAPPFLQMETGSGSRSNRCISKGLVYNSGICQPAMVPDTSMPHQGEGASCKNGPSSSTMEDSVMVSSPTGATGGLSSGTTTTTGPNNDTIRSGIPDASRNSIIDRLAYLRESYTSKGFSSEASDLMLSSWRPKTNSNYGSSFTRWASWCKQRDQDPLSGPVSDIVNFLAELFNKGYQNQSLNSYRSAISSVHERIDGFSVGQHPAITRALKGAYHSRPPLP